MVAVATAPTRVPPCDIEAEESLLGAMMLSRDAVAAAANVGVNAADFYKPEHARVFDAIIAVDTAGAFADPTTVAAHLNGVIPRKRLLDLQALTPASANAHAYAVIVRSLATRRRQLATVSALSDALYTGEPPDGLIAELTANQSDGVAEPTWQPVELDPWLDGHAERVVPTILRREDNIGLFYPGRVNGLHGDSGVGKSFVIAVAISQELREARHVGIVDLEDPDPSTLIERLRLLGADDSTIREHLHYWAPREAFTERAVAGLAEVARSLPLSLLVIDSLGEAFGLEGLDENLDRDVGPFLRRVPRALADAGPCVITVDHSTKANDNPLHPSGSKRKRAAITGASFLVDATKPLDREHGGKLRLTCAKDRHGHFRRGDVAAVVDLATYPDAGISSRVWPPIQRDDREVARARQRCLARSVVDVVRDAGRPLTQREILAALLGVVKAGTDAKRAAIDLAVGEGALRTEDGRKGATLHAFVRELADPEQADV